MDEDSNDIDPFSSLIISSNHNQDDNFLRNKDEITREKLKAVRKRKDVIVDGSSINSLRYKLKVKYGRQFRSINNGKKEKYCYGKQRTLYFEEEFGCLPVPALPIGAHIRTPALLDPPAAASYSCERDGRATARGGRKTRSTLLPKKHKVIEGVDTVLIVQFKAQLVLYLILAYMLVLASSARFFLRTIYLAQFHR